MKKITAVLIALFVCGSAVAHPMHANVTEVEWNSETRRFEVAMRLNAAALEDAISVAREDVFRLESDEDDDGALRNYVSAHFDLQHPDADESTIRWAGHELELHAVWVYFEVIPRATHADEHVSLSRSRLEAVRVENRCLFDVGCEMQHLMTIRSGTSVRQIHTQRADTDRPHPTTSPQARPGEGSGARTLPLSDPLNADHSATLPLRRSCGFTLQQSWRVAGDLRPEDRPGEARPPRNPGSSPERR